MKIKDLDYFVRQELCKAFEKIWPRTTQSFYDMYYDKTIDYVRGLFTGKFVEGCEDSRLFLNEYRRILEKTEKTKKKS